MTLLNTTKCLSTGGLNLTIGIDASNLLQGGGRTHLTELLRAAEPESNGFSKLVVWGNQSTLALLNDHPWLEKINPPALEGGLLSRTVWQRFHLSDAARQAGCNILFVPGGSYFGDFHSVVTMSRNMLPFEWRELFRYGLSWVTFRLILLRWVQKFTFRRVDGVIFLTNYAKLIIENVTGKLKKSTVIAHGLNERFLQPPHYQRPVEACTASRPFNILYVSIIDQYKHQWRVVEAVAALRRKTGWHLALDLVGPAYPPALNRLQAAIAIHDPGNEWVRYHGPVLFDKLHSIYHGADLGLFASSCENMPNILIETMASGLPIASSNRGPMPEILQDMGIYFDPEDSSDIERALEGFIADPQLRKQYADASFLSSHQYNWGHCANATFAFIAEVAQLNSLRSNSCAA